MSSRDFADREDPGEQGGGRASELRSVWRLGWTTQLILQGRRRTSTQPRGKDSHALSFTEVFLAEGSTLCSSSWRRRERQRPAEEARGSSLVR